VNKIGVDFLALSGHKMLGPTGTGILYVREEHYETLDSFMVGGGTVEWSKYEDHRLLPFYERYEAGLQNYAGELGLAAAARYLKSVGMKNVARHEHELTTRLHEGLTQVEGVSIIGVEDPSLRGGITSFMVDGVMYHDVAMILNRNYNVMVRSGQHCLHSWFDANNVEGSVRASLYLYNDRDEVDTLIEAVETIAKLG
jgi:cysteine desulfurase/selenocysteine lyase